MGERPTQTIPISNLGMVIQFLNMMDVTAPLGKEGMEKRMKNVCTHFVQHGLLAALWLVNLGPNLMKF